MKKINVLISAGGTGGHMIPSQQLANMLRADGKCEIFFMAKGLKDNQNFRRDIYPYKEISSCSLSKNFFLFSFLILKGLFQSIFYLFRKKIDIVVGFGSYHTFPVTLAAFILKRPFVLFESNCSLGKVNRFFAKGAKAIAIQFRIKGMENYEKTELVPLLPWISKEVKMDKFLARSMLGLKKELFTFLVFGGSQGSVFINDLFSLAVREIKKERLFQVIHICGDACQKERMEKIYESIDISSYVSVYEKEMVPLYCSSDLAICQAGAVTLAELLFFELPSILIPYLYASEAHQLINAKFFEKKIGGGVLFEQDKFDYKKFVKILLQFTSFNDQKLMEMKSNLCNFKKLTERENRKSLNKIIYEVLRQP